MHHDATSPNLRGLLFSQVGYDSGFPVRIIVRSTVADDLPAGTICCLTATGNLQEESAFSFWGELWGSHWWIAEFPPGLKQGRWNVSVRAGSEVLMQADGLDVADRILWDRTLFPMAVEMLESRAVMAKAKCGWMDAGCMWQESNAHSSMILGLLDLLEFGADRIDSDIFERIRNQVVNGCDYLALTGEKATELGYPPGALSHDVIGQENEILPNDAFKAVVAWRRASRLLPDSFDEARKRYTACADRTLHWLTTAARPLGDKGFCRSQRGLPDDTPIPADEWPTRDLVMLCWGALETWKCGQSEARKLCTETARAIMRRQVTRENPEAGFHGHFREFDSLEVTENAWSHSIFGNQFGSDAGGTFPNYLIALIGMLKLWPDDPEAAAWRATLENFTYGYLIPACRKNPFLIIPQGVFGNEGPLWFTGTFHGMNVIYGLTAALALELANVFDVPYLTAIAYGNLQWIAGLNAGLTKTAMEKGSVIFRTDIEASEALPVSMIHGVGRRTAGTWFATRGVICNGFGTGRQFEFDVPTTRDQDGPHSFTDEDWIPHSAGWLSGLVRL